jgi:hypothetical protein
LAMTYIHVLHVLVIHVHMSVKISQQCYLTLFTLCLFLYDFETPCIITIKFYH